LTFFAQRVCSASYCKRWHLRGPPEGFESIMLLSKFGNEVLSKGPESVLPQNLTPAWLERIQKMADSFLDTHFDGEKCLWDGFAADPILTACVSEILRYQNRDSVEIQEREMFDKLTMYALAVTIETVRKEATASLPVPTLDDIFDKRRYLEIENSLPQFGSILKFVCLNTGT